MSNISLPAPSTTTEVTAEILSTMAAESGVVTDYNPGSQIRTQSESIGAVIEQQGVWAQALAFQAVVYCALGLFGIVPGVASPASGVLLFSTSPADSGGPPSPLNVSIVQGTLAQTPGGVQVVTIAGAVLLNGSSGVIIPAQAVVSGSAGNVPASGVSQIISGLAAPLFVTNPAAFGGGTDPTTPSQSLALFAAEIGSIGLSSPAAIANAAIGVTASGTGETCLFSTLFEPWLWAMDTGVSGAASGMAGWQLIIDNGTGNASPALIAAVNAKLNAGTVSGATNSGPIVGYRDAGVPYSIYAVDPTLAVVSISGTTSNPYTEGVVSGAMSAAVSGYFSLPFGTAAEQAQIAAVVTNAAQGSLTSISVSLSAVSGSPVDLLTPPVSGRVILSQLNLYLSSG